MDARPDVSTPPLPVRIVDPPGGPILAIAARPDDIESWGAGTLARAAGAGATVRLLVVPSSDKGTADADARPWTRRPGDEPTRPVIFAGLGAIAHRMPRLGRRRRPVALAGEAPTSSLTTRRCGTTKPSRRSASMRCWRWCGSSRPPCSCAATARSSAPREPAPCRAGRTSPVFAFAARRNDVPSLHAAVADKGVDVGGLSIGAAIERSPFRAERKAAEDAGAGVPEVPAADPHHLAKVLWTMHGTRSRPEGSTANDASPTEPSNERDSGRSRRASVERSACTRAGGFGLGGVGGCRGGDGQKHMREPGALVDVEKILPAPSQGHERPRMGRVTSRDE